MEIVNGVNIQSLPIGGLNKVADLIYFDGPLLSLFRNEGGDSYLYYWCDSNEILNRWLIFRVSDQSLNSYLSKKIPLRELLLNPSDGFLYLADLNDELQFHNLLLIFPRNLPDLYVPDVESFYEFQPITVTGRIQDQKGDYRILLNKDWTLEDLSKVPHVYSEVYAFLYSLFEIDKRGNKLVHGAFRSYPWRGGYSVLNFYNRLKSYLPESKPPQIVSIQYASPGWIELELMEHIAVSIKNVVTAYEASHEEVESFYQSTHRTLSDRNLLRGSSYYEKPSPTVDDLKFIDEATRHLSRLLRLENFSSINNVTNDPLITLKILLSFFRRLSTLSTYQVEGKVQY
jgi:hypothetical protein